MNEQTRNLTREKQPEPRDTMALLKTFDIKSIKDFASIPLNLFNIPVTKVHAGKRLTLMVGKDRVRCYLMVDIVEEMYGITMAEVEAIMAQAGIPLDPARKPEIEAMVAAIASGAAPQGPFVIAEGRPRVDGEDSKVTWYVNVGGDGLDPAHDPLKVNHDENENARADYREVRRIVTVENGQKLCSISPPGKGVNGVDVYGKPIPANDGREIRFDVGEGVSFNPANAEYSATDSGYVMLENRRLIVSPVMVVDAVDFRVGNIDYKGKVIVNGDVGEGFIVKAGKELSVGGVAKDARLIAARNMSIEALLGAKGLAECGGDLSISRINNATARSDGRVAVLKEMVNASIHAAGPVSASEASMAGGEIVCLGPVHLHTMGNSENASAQQSVTIDPYKLRTSKLVELYAKLTVITDDLAKIKAGLGALAENRALVKSLPAAKQDPINKLLQRMDTLSLQQAAVNGEIDRNRAPLEKRLLPEVYIKRVCPGSRITIFGYTRVFNDPINDPIKVSLPKGASELKVEPWLSRGEADLG